MKGQKSQKHIKKKVLVHKRKKTNERMGKHFEDFFLCQDATEK